jgi:ABC-type cobalt transport system substrate-binding protein
MSEDYQCKYSFMVYYEINKVAIIICYGFTIFFEPKTGEIEVKLFVDNSTVGSVFLSYPLNVTGISGMCTIVAVKVAKYIACGLCV